METVLDIKQIQEFLPHRYPFLLIDKVVECEPGVRLVGVKNVTYNEPFFQGHFPHMSIFPGVLILEALAQATGLLASETSPDELGHGMTYFLTGIDKAKFKRPVVPGDQIMLEAVFERSRRNIWSFNCTATVDGEFVASANIRCAAVGDKID
ncbi:3-hydroxyacyl-[acyl-carrier-protein] dehydratase [Bathymodiolus platifrons methanotrophic gill symbiont]|uniref:3-hydroxyacyl-ACP dehydratase FabZ n=1 Tax=Bathymodiolus platifrons methanotrophic gill symbiont TaxID=113268 RepID=UPI000B4110D5|nr:3-hydroxyacyl-ACP dehydratase FabZ [Bathymodiolus platifrons methanotrophic gill symbiont]MCK5869356.1 3-hydroxyacyl-ACP dehydratase FabZ [Methyloprofundus sp.]TXK95724.1 3-hydroxyacyl-[acyl-carrier-protein] dehydratase FabZ [Methylococcaceae bacterium CS4]TXK96946.1 3-hydroxyacyl-[acyl-carrier-protein] dehydratase FabZ [Methylococcaceae bacterium CS5]TXK99773.1 3-hydroxyacyl-[acyl-carrier-protein] dehydratase FabZ [Methylococcaceae bacterium HT1]TXL03842.1 3-hydroxyacyl-[acyl-carrier-prote